MPTVNPRSIRIGVQIAPQHVDYPAIRSAAAQAEDIGVDIIFNWDHFLPISGDEHGKHFECWTMLAAWAEQTSRVHLGPMVTSISFRNPDLVADMARTIDHISGGRMLLGIGAGAMERDFAEYGYDFGTPAGRLQTLADALPRIEQRFAKLNPPPTRRIPVLIGGGGERKTLRLVAEHADIWHWFSSGAEFARKKQILIKHCAEIGRDPREIELSAGVQGDPEVVGAELLEQGVTTFTLEVHGPDFDMSTVRAWVQWRDDLTVRP
ncbi:MULTISPECIES: LLM class F420-dependent oxidoreductase [Nocardia]|uniref:LLM class F420-dependent oxidoreductase n=2 Tax=Nocardia TaxID=1817 RepID=A0A2T2YQY8_9NOCA|nr:MULTISPECIES: LLM class F420-dependent oxidoreductase [Nocardia]MBF6446187.1 LLM class F420-dependent oxidoreductase [Nocardia elegans]PSR57927.1 LLM class F420-dependent oxidoreductase [Nocardia nova]